MISIFRDFVKSWAATALLGLLIIAFAFLGIYNGNSGSLRGAVVSAGSRSVTDATFKRQFDSYLQELSRPQNRVLTLEEAIKGGVDKKVLEEMGQIEAFSELITRAGIHPSDKLIRDQIAQAPIFLDPVSRTFSQEAYQRQISQMGYASVKDFEVGPSKEMSLESYKPISLPNFKWPAKLAASWEMPSIKSPSPFRK